MDTPQCAYMLGDSLPWLGQFDTAPFKSRLSPGGSTMLYCNLSAINFIFLTYVDTVPKSQMIFYYY